jgi:hypothetical protein
MFSGSRIVACGQTDMTKLVVAFCNFANAPKNSRPKNLKFNCMAKKENLNFRAY